MQTSSESHHLRTGWMALLAAIVTAGVSSGAAPRSRGQVPMLPRGMRQVQMLENLPVAEVPSAVMEGSGTRGYSPKTLVSPNSRVVGPVQSALVPSEDPFIDQGPIIPSGEVIVNDPAVVEPIYGQLPYGDPSAVAFEAGPAPVYSSGQWQWRGTWYSRAEMLMLKLHDKDNYPLASDDINFSQFPPFAGAAGNQTLSIGETGFRFEPGMRITMGRFIGRDAANRDHSAEITYSGLFRWDDRGVLSAGASSTTGVSTMLNNIEIFDQFGRPTILYEPVPGFTGADEQQFEYTSELNGLEVSYRLRTRPGRDQLALQPNGSWVRHNNSGRLLSLIGGFRYISLSEGFLYTSSGEDAQLQPVEGLYTVDIDNSLVGTQVGWEMTEQHTNWSWGILGKTGGYINFSERRSDIDTVNGIDPRSQTLDTSTLAWVGEASLFGSYYIRPNFSLRASYNLIYMNGLSRVIDNIGLAADFPDYHTRADAIIHGLSIGAECVW